MAAKTLNRIEQLIESKIEAIKNHIFNLGGKTNHSDVYLVVKHMYSKEFSVQYRALNFYHFMDSLRIEKVIEELNCLELTRQSKDA